MTTRLPAGRLRCAALDFIDRHEVIHFIGQSGTGKSHLAIALGVEAVRSGRSVYFSPLADIIDSLARAEREGRRAADHAGCQPATPPRASAERPRTAHSATANAPQR